MDWTTVWVAVGSLATFAGLILAAITRITSHISKQNEQQIKLQTEQKQQDQLFKQDWYGQPARPGVPPAPGVMERLSKIEQNTTALPDRVAQAERDIVDIRHTQTMLNTRLEDHLRVDHTHPTIIERIGNEHQ